MFPGICINSTVLRLDKNFNGEFFFHNERLLQFGQLSYNPCATASAAVLSLVSVNCHIAGRLAKHPSFCTSSSARLQIKKRKNRLKDLKNILGLEYLVDRSQTNDDDKQPEGSHG